MLIRMFLAQAFWSRYTKWRHSRKMRLSLTGRLQDSYQHYRGPVGLSFWNSIYRTLYFEIWRKEPTRL